MPDMIKNLFCFSIVVFLGVLAGCSAGEGKKNLDYTSFVDPLIGSGGHGHVFVGASVPHGMVQLGPNNASKGWDWCSGYHDSDSTIVGFAHTHLSGTGIADLGDIAFMPVLSDRLESGNDPYKRYVATFFKRNQVVEPGYYSVKLNEQDIQVELTSTERAGFQRYTYPRQADPSVIIDLDEGVKSLEARKGTLKAGFRLVNDSTISGYRISDEWAKDHKVYFTAVFSRPITGCRLYKDGKLTSSTSGTGVQLQVKLDFKKSDQPLLVKTGISYVSEKGAFLNLNKEIDHWHFDEVRAAAKKKWNESLSVIDFHAADTSAVEIFYTSLFHTMIAPSLFADADGRYRGADGMIYRAKDFTPYTTFSLWDTYRAVHPLYTLIDKKVPDYVNSLLSIYDQQKTMPVWSLVGNETDCMVGRHSIPVVVDAALKGFPVDKKRIFGAVSSLENMNMAGLDHVRTRGYIPADQEPWSVAKGLEYAIDDFAIAELAANLDYKAEYENFRRRSLNYRHYFDADKGFMRGKLSSGSWRTNFNPFHSVHLEDDYVEGNAWQYTWLVPHDVYGLIDLFGGKKRFVNKLDSLFTVSSELNEGASVDISGMIGQYAHGNEPSHHILYLYAYAGEQSKTAGLVRKVFDQFYTTRPDGLIGNEDCGQMSAWYIFSSLGFYPVNPVSGIFVFGSPITDHATVRLQNGRQFEIIAKNNSEENKYIQSVSLNGLVLDKPYINYSSIMKGGTLVFQMGSKPNENWYDRDGRIPESSIPQL